MELASLTPPPLSSPTHRLLVALIFIISAPSMAMLLWILGPGFGKPQMLSVMMLCLISPICLGMSLGVFCGSRLADRQHFILVVSAITTVLLSFVVLLSPAGRAAMLADRINDTLLAAEKNLGHPSPLAATLAPLLATHATVRAHHDYLVTLRRSKSSPEEVTSFLAYAEKFEVDATFVRVNGFVRTQDTASLEHRAQVLAEQGNAEARRWVKAHSD